MIKTPKHQGLARHPAYVLMGLFAVIVVLLGGSSRFDQSQIIALRPLACLFLIPAFLFVSKLRLARIRVPLILLLCLAAYAALQLVPLPPAIWHSLPGREVVASLDAAVGLPEIWRPMSLSPMRTANMLASLIVPIVALLLLATQRDTKGRFVHYCVIAAALLNALIGALQLAGGTDSALYTYAVTNAGSPVGIFANRNHSAVFAALAMLSITYLIFADGKGRHKSAITIGLGAVYVVILGVALASQSRSGLLMCVAALAFTLGIALWQGGWQRSRGPGSMPKNSHGRRAGWRAGWRAEGRSAESSPLRLPAKKAVPLAVTGLSLVIIFGLLFFADRIPALDRFGSDGPVEEMRWAILPSLLHMAWGYFPFGSGFGSFELAFYIHEKPELLSPFYINQAHNDWLQLIIEGGVIAAALLAMLLTWLAKAIIKLVRGSPGDRLLAAYWIGIVVVVSFASMFDYPLRTPIFSMFLAWLVGDLAVRVSGGHDTAARAVT